MKFQVKNNKFLIYHNKTRNKQTNKTLLGLKATEITFLSQCQTFMRKRSARSVQKVSSHVLRKRETFIEEDTGYKKYYAQDNDASVPFKQAPWDLTQLVLPIAISCPVVFLNFTDGQKSLPF